MKVCIHRGAAEIGGNCIEVESQGKRIVLDLGRPLSAEWNEEVPLPGIPGLAEPDATLLGVLVSHGHQDHWGLATQISKDVPVYIGDATSRMLREADFFTRGLDVEPTGTFRHRESFDVGPFRITPYLMDHSAYDAHSLLIEADGKRLFYSADVQAHGRKWKIFEELRRKPPKDIDVLLLEGTNIRAETEATSEKTPTEDSLVADIAATIKATEGLVMVSHSAQNIDRLVTLYKATRKAKRTLVLDLYGASIAAATGNPKIPHLGDDWPHVRVFLSGRQIGRIKETEQFHRAADVKPYRLFVEDIAASPKDFVLTANVATAAFLAQNDALAGSHAIWSLWPGYLKEGSGKKFESFLKERDIPLTIHHVSGHAYARDLQRLATALEAKRLVPIHSSATDRFGDYFSNVERHADGDWWGV